MPIQQDPKQSNSVIPLSEFSNIAKNHRKLWLWIILAVIAVFSVIVVWKMTGPQEKVTLSCNPKCEVWSTPGHFTFVGNLPDKTVATVIEKDEFAGIKVYRIKASGMEGWITENDIQK